MARVVYLTAEGNRREDEFEQDVQAQEFASHLLGRHVRVLHTLDAYGVVMQAFADSGDALEGEQLAAYADTVR